MLEKTLSLLKDIPPGTFVPDDKECFDDAEVAALGQLLGRLVYAPSKLRRRLQDFGVTITRSDFYSEIPTVAELNAHAAQPPRPWLENVFPANDRMCANLADLAVYAGEFDPPERSDVPGTYAWHGSAFGYSDAMAYYCIIRARKPRTIIEIGSGWSTLIARMALDRNGGGRLICIEPFPPDFITNLPGIEMVRETAQRIGHEALSNALGDGDILFIDSTHTVKHESDVLHIYLRLLPALRHRVFIHAHDIYLPEPMPVWMARDHQLYWTEQYILYAYLLGNPRTRVLFGSRYFLLHNPDLLRAFMHGRAEPGGGSFWFEQAAI